MACNFHFALVRSPHDIVSIKKKKSVPAARWQCASSTLAMCQRAPVLLFLNYFFLAVESNRRRHEHKRCSRQNRLEVRYDKSMSSKSLPNQPSTVLESLISCLRPFDNKKSCTFNQSILASIARSCAVGACLSKADTMQRSPIS